MLIIMPFLAKRCRKFQSALVIYALFLPITEYVYDTKTKKLIGTLYYKHAGNTLTYKFAYLL